MEKTIYQVSTLQALLAGYTKKVITVGELIAQGDTGLGTYENVAGEMILLDGHCYCAKEDGNIVEAGNDIGVPFATCKFLEKDYVYGINDMKDIEELKNFLNNRIEETFGLNSMHVIRIDGEFEKVSARSEKEYVSQHIELREILAEVQKDFFFENVKGSLICMYFPDYMDGINAPGWHFHFVSEDRTQGGHVFDIQIKNGMAYADKAEKLFLQMPDTPAFDTYSLKNVSKDEVKNIEQGG